MCYDFVAFADLQLSGCSDSILANLTAKYGGVAYTVTNTSGLVNITHTDVAFCTADFGGVVYADSCDNFDLEGSQFRRNHAKHAGGVVYFTTVENVACEGRLLECSGHNTAGGYGDCQATGVAAIDAQPSDLDGVVSGAAQSPAVRVLAVDVFQQHLTSISERLVVSAVSVSDQLAVSGKSFVSRRQSESPPYLNFSQLSLQAAPGSSQRLVFKAVFPLHINVGLPAVAGSHVQA